MTHGYELSDAMGRARADAQNAAITMMVKHLRWDHNYTVTQITNKLQITRKQVSEALKS